VEQSNQGKCPAFAKATAGRRAPRVSTLHSELGTRNSEFKQGFTLLELLVALTILVVAFTIVWSTFSATIKAWQRGGALLEELRHGDFVMEQLVSSLRSAAFFPNAPEKYGFWLKSRGGEYPRDRISWVSSSSAFMPPDSPLNESLHRITFGIENNKEGDPSVTIRAWPHLSEDTVDDVDPWYISSEVKGFNCRVYNAEDEDWDTEWEDTNSIPSLVEITLYMDPIEKYGEPVKLQRLVEIPIAPAVTNAVNTSGAGSSGGDEAGGRGAEATASRKSEGGPSVEAR